MAKYHIQLYMVNIRPRARGGSRAAATAKMERFVITIITKRSILDVAAALYPRIELTTILQEMINLRCYIFYTHLKVEEHE